MVDEGEGSIGNDQIVDCTGPCLPFQLCYMLERLLHLSVCLKEIEGYGGGV